MTNATPVKQSSLRLLILSPSPPDIKSIPPVKTFLEAITGTKPSDEITSFAGYTSHPPLRLSTKYYTADVGIWCDELPSETQISEQGTNQLGPDEAGSSEIKTLPTLSDWKTQILSPEAAEVRNVIGGIILILPIPPTSTTTTVADNSTYLSLISTVHTLRETIEDESYGRDVASMVVLQPTVPTAAGTNKSKLNELTDRLEDVSLSDHGILGWDFVAWDGELPNNNANNNDDATDYHEKKPGNERLTSPEVSNDDDDEDESLDNRNQFGEKTGLDRAIEVLEAVDWSASPNDDDEGLGDGEFDIDIDFTSYDGEDIRPSTGRFNLAGSTLSGLDFELQREMMELKMSMLDEDEDEDENDEEEEDSPANPGSTHDKAESSSSPSSSTLPKDLHSRDKSNDQETQIEQFPALFERVVAIREAGSEMSPAERERFARREVARIIREMG